VDGVVLTYLLTIGLLAVALAAPASAFDGRPNPAITGGSVRIDGHVSGNFVTLVVTPETVFDCRDTPVS
jgi:hypothetical protein